MSWTLVRVDDRLIHGQVVIAWGERLAPRRIWVADDASAANAWERELLASSVPDIEVRVVTVAEAAAGFDAERAAPGGAFLLVRDLPAALALHRAGARFPVLNLGGLHHAPGKRKVNEYVFLGDADRDAARELHVAGVRLEVQDVPASAARVLTELDPTVLA